MNKDRESVIIVRKKKGHGHGHHGGAWKVAFADFMTAMFALFLVLWLVNQSPKVKNAVAGYFKDPLGKAEYAGTSVIPGEASPGPPKIATRKQMEDAQKRELEALKARILGEIAKNPEFARLAEHLEIELTPEGLRIQLLEDSTGVFFEAGNATPRASVRDFLGALGREIATVPNGVVVEGYTDARAYAPAATYTNWELSADRANVARRILQGGGLPERQIMQVRGHGERSLRYPAEPLSPRNRRVTITMLWATIDSAAAISPDSVATASAAAVQRALENPR